MTSIIKSIENTNCNLALKNSSFFSLYHSKLKKNQYYKSNNQIKSYYKDPILNDFIYLSTNGLKKNAIFRQTEIKSTINSSGFVSYFTDLEDNLSVFTLYPKTYLTSIINNYKNNKKIITNVLDRSNSSKILNSNFSINKLSSVHRHNHIFLKNYFSKTAFLNHNSNIFFVNSKLFNKELFSGLLYIFPKKLQKSFKNLFLLNFLILNFYTNIKIKKNLNKLFLSNLYIYTFYLKYLNYKIITFLKEKNIKIRKSN